MQSAGIRRLVFALVLCLGLTGCRGEQRKLAERDLVGTYQFEGSGSRDLEILVLEPGGRYRQERRAPGATATASNMGRWSLESDHEQQYVNLFGARTWGHDRWGSRGPADRAVDGSLTVDRTGGHLRLILSFDTMEGFVKR